MIFPTKLRRIIKSRKTDFLRVGITGTWSGRNVFDLTNCDTFPYSNCVMHFWVFVGSYFKAIILRMRRENSWYLTHWDCDFFWILRLVRIRFEHWDLGFENKYGLKNGIGTSCQVPPPLDWWWGCAARPLPYLWPKSAISPSLFMTWPMSDTPFITWSLNQNPASNLRYNKFPSSDLECKNHSLFSYDHNGKNELKSILYFHS